MRRSLARCSAAALTAFSRSLPFQATVLQDLPGLLVGLLLLLLDRRLIRRSLPAFVLVSFALAFDPSLPDLFVLGQRAVLSAGVGGMVSRRRRALSHRGTGRRRETMRRRPADGGVTRSGAGLTSPPPSGAEVHHLVRTHRGPSVSSLGGGSWGACPPRAGGHFRRGGQASRGPPAAEWE